jgi:hypothetical protein
MSMRALSGRLAALLVLVAVVVSSIAFENGQANVADRPAQSPAERLASALAATVELDFKETSLSDVAEFLEEKHDIKVHIDEKALADAGIVLDIPVTFQILGISLRSAMRLLLRPLDLTMFSKEDMLWITTKDVHDDYCEPRVYEVLDLVVQPGADPLDTRRYDFDSLIDLIQNTVRPDAWQATGGLGAIERLREAAAIVISINPECQDDIVELLSMLRRARDQQFAEGSLKPLPQRSLTSISTHAAAAPAIRKILAKKVDFESDQEPLEVVLKNIAAKWKIPVMIDHRSLAEANVALDSQVSLKLKTLSLGSGLKILLEPLDLRWMIANEVLFVTTKDVANDATVLRVYPVSEFDDREGGTRRPTGDGIDSLRDVLQNVASPDSWTATGGPGSIEYFPNARSLVVTQTEKVHEEIERLLASLRLARYRQIPPQPAPPAVDVNDDTMHLKVYWPPKSLLPPVQAGGYSGMGGGGYFSVTDQLPPSRAIASPGKDVETNVPNSVLPQFGFAHPIFQGQPDLAVELAKIIPQVVEPESWKEAGGKGTIQSLQGRMIVRQTNRVHAQIAKFLREL